VVVLCRIFGREHHHLLISITSTMTTLKTTELLREFYYNGVRIPDPGPEMTVDQVRDLLTPTYPEMATASLTGPEDMGDVLRYTFNRAIGSKG
jgi:PRTRC genetic system protein C